MTATPSTPADPVRAAILVIAGALALRLAMGLAIGLGTDEIYTVAVSRQLSLSYFDHPPLHQWLTHGAAALLGEGRQVRLPFILLFAATSWLLFGMTRRLYGAAAGFWAVVALNLAGFFTLSAGSWVVPDGTLLFGLALAGAGLARLLFPAREEEPRPWRSWLIAGLGFGISGLSKYQAAVVALGALGFIAAHPRGRALLAHPAPWAAGLLALALVSPVLIWNAANGWVSFLFQSGRAQGGGFAPWLAPLSLLAQAGWLLPWVFAPLAAGLALAWRTARDARLGFLLALGLPTILLFTLLPMFGNLGLPHWAMPGWFFLMPLAGLHLAKLAEEGQRAARWARISAIGSIAALALLASHAATGWVTRLAPALVRADPTIETFGWDQLPGELARLGMAEAGGFVIADSWQNAGRIDVALGGRAPVLAGTLDPRHYAFVTSQAGLIGRDGVAVVRARREAQMRALLAPHVRALGPATPIALGRGALREIELVAIPVTGFDKPLPWAYGRRP